MASVRRALIIGFALLGLGASSFSTYVHYNLLTDPSYASVCDVSATVNCSDAYRSQYGSLFGVPVALDGVVFFVVILLLATFAARPTSPARGNAPAYILVLSALGLAFALYLAWASYFVLKTFCILCAITYASVIAIFIVAAGDGTAGMAALPRRALRDLRTAVTTPLPLVLTLLIIGGSAMAMARFPREATPAVEPQAKLPSLTSDQRAQLEAWWKVQPTVDLRIPAASGAKVQLVVFSDYQCPACKAAHDVLRRVLAAYDRTAVEFVLKHYPLEGECNPNVPQGNHFAACEAAAAHVMARGTGFQQKLDDWLFENQPTLSPAVVKDAARVVAGITDYDARYGSALQEVRKDASLGGALQIKSTPTVFLNGRMIAGSGNGLPPAPYVDALIDIELKRK